MSPREAVELTPEQQAPAEIHGLLPAAGSSVREPKQAAIYASRGVAICEFPLADWCAFADYLLYVEARVAGIVETPPTETLMSWNLHYE